jgi:hypothetical protein
MKNVITLTTTVLAIVAFALTPSAAKAQSFTGNFPVSVTEVEAGIAGNIKGSNQAFCMVLTDDGSFGRAHSGPATLESFGGSSLPGTFQVIGKTIIATFETRSDNGEAGGLVLVAPANASNGTIGVGVYDLVFGESEASGLATFGMKNGC